VVLADRLDLGLDHMLLHGLGLVQCAQFAQCHGEAGLGVDGIAEHDKPSLRREQASGGLGQPRGHREACFSAHQGFQRVPVYADRDLSPQQEIRGPAFVQNDYLTMLVLPGQIGRIDGFGNLVVDHARGRFFHA